MSALQLKEEGNQAFQSGNYSDALKKYSLALDTPADSSSVKDRAAVLSNRSAAYFKLGLFDSAYTDAEACIKLRPDWGKGYYRKGQALENMGKLFEAMDAYKLADEKAPNSKDVYDCIAMLQMRLVAEHARIKNEKFGHERKRESEEIKLKGGLGFSGHEFVSKGETNSAAWAEGLDSIKKYEWFVDCYRMRCDDIYAYQGEFVGIYQAYADGNKFSVLEDFLVFCKMAVRNKVIPEKWDWKSFIEASLKLLPYAFEKDDAQEKYGGENVFSGLLGGRSLRYTAELVYGSSIMEGELGSQEYYDLVEKIDDQWRSLQRNRNFFSDVGGFEVWRNLERKFRLKR
jgi:tetratricopeptide (TPR) repeat protein